jgi:hypothetical protein
MLTVIFEIEYDQITASYFLLKKIMFLLINIWDLFYFEENSKRQFDFSDFFKYNHGLYGR